MGIKTPPLTPFSRYGCERGEGGVFENGGDGSEGG